MVFDRDNCLFVVVIDFGIIYFGYVFFFCFEYLIEKINIYLFVWNFG